MSLVGPDGSVEAALCRFLPVTLTGRQRVCSGGRKMISCLSRARDSPLSLTAQAAGKLEKKGRRGRGSHVVLKKKLAGRHTALGRAGDGKARLGCPRGGEPHLGGRGRWQGQDAWRLSVPTYSHRLLYSSWEHKRLGGGCRSPGLS